MSAVTEISRFQVLGHEITVERHDTATGEVTLWVTGEDQRKRAYHSRVDPRHEARQQLEAFYGTETENVLWVYLGIGLGYLVEELDRLPPAGLVCVECNEGLLNGQRSLEKTEYIVYLIGKTPSEALAEIEKIRLQKGCKDVRVVTNPAALSSFPSYYLPLLNGLHPLKTSQPAPRFLIKERRSEGCYLIVDTGYFLVRELAAALESQGHLAMILRLPLEAATAAPDPSRYPDFLRKLVEAVEHLQPEALITVNHLGFDREGILTELLARLKLPALVWYVDSPRYIFQNPQANTSDWIGTFSWDRSYLSWLRQQGFEHVHYLPLGTDAHIFNTATTRRKEPPRRRADKHPPLVFVGDSMSATVQKAFHKLPEDLQRDLTQHPASLTSRIRAEFLVEMGSYASSRGELPWRAFERVLQSLGVDRHSLPGLLSRTEFNLLDLESYLTLVATRQRRLGFLQDLCLLPQESAIKIIGDADWQGVLSQPLQQFPDRLEIQTTADYYQDLPLIYQEAGAVLNLTGLQMPHGLNQRCYDVPAAGGFLLTDSQPAVAEQFELNREMITFASLPDLLEKWKYYQQHPRQRQEVINQGLRRVLQQHTYRHRLQEMLKVAQAWFS